jgi:hypothetical protein
MDQSTWIAGFLLAAFVLFLAARNRLSTYAAVLWGPTAAATPGASSTSGGSSSANDILAAGENAIGIGPQTSTGSSIVNGLNDIDSLFSF